MALFLLGITAVIIGRPGSSNGDEVLFSPDPGQAEPQPEQTPGPRQPSEEVRTPDPVPQGGDQRPDPGEPSEQATPRPEAVTDGDTGGGTNDDGAADDQDGAIGEGLIAQVLNAADDPDAYAEAADELEGLGYEVVRSGAAGRRYDETTVFYNDGLQADAEALRETEPRFAEVRPNDRGLSNDVDLHVVVGRDWAE